MKTIKTGAQVLMEKDGFASTLGRVGLVCNPTSLLPGYVHLADALIDCSSVNLCALFGPEHGIFSAVQDQVGVENASYRGVPVFSLYGDTEESLLPTEGMLEKCDTLIFDIQDVGSRYYTYIWTMTGCMTVCAKMGIRFVVCDRPNPIANFVQGPLLEDGFESFVGRHTVCIRHGMTAGEIAGMFNSEKNVNCDLTVITCESLNRSQWYDQTGLKWVAPSPNMPTLDTATVYPGGCLIEGTNLSEGRGTTKPFEQVGAPFLDGRSLAAALNNLELPGVHFRPICFQPAFSKHAGKNCGGVFVHVTDRKAFLPVESFLALIIETKNQAPNDFAWRTESYEFVDKRPAVDLLFGDSKTRESIDNRMRWEDISLVWQKQCEEFKERRKPFLLYWNQEDL